MSDPKQILQQARRRIQQMPPEPRPPRAIAPPVTGARRPVIQLPAHALVAVRQPEQPAAGDSVVIRGGSPIAQVMANVLSGMQSAQRLRESVALALWARAVGPQIAAATRAEEVRDGILFVRTRSSTWSHEIEVFLKPEILLKLNRLLGAPIIKNIRCRARGVPKEELKDEREIPSAEELAQVILDAPEAEELELHLATLEAVPDPRIREALSNRLRQDARVRHWRLERGWTLCPRCGAAHKTPHRLCGLCEATE